MPWEMKLCSWILTVAAAKRTCNSNQDPLKSMVLVNLATCFGLREEGHHHKGLGLEVFGGAPCRLWGINFTVRSAFALHHTLNPKS